MKIIDVPADKIKRGNNDRKHFNQRKLRELANSIAENGIAQLPTVRLLEDGYYEIVAGERRIKAMRDYLHYDVIPVQVRELSDEQAASIMLLENTSRTELNPIEESNAYQVRVEVYGWDIAHVSKVAGVSRKRVESRLRLQNLSNYVQGLVQCGALPVKYAEKLCDLDKNRQYLAVVVWKHKPTMSLMLWQEVVDKFCQEQQAETQQSFLSLVSEQIQTVKKHVKRKTRGPKAVTGVKCCAATIMSFPRKNDSAEKLVNDYIQYLRGCGYDEGAGAVANIFNVLVDRGYLSLNAKSHGVLDKDALSVSAELRDARRVKQIMQSTK